MSIRKRLEPSSKNVSSQLALAPRLEMLVIPLSVNERSKVQDFQENSLTVAQRIRANVNSISWRVTLQEEVQNRVEIVNFKPSFLFVEKYSTQSKHVLIRYSGILKSKISL
jgi:hypothetical protein